MRRTRSVRAVRSHAERGNEMLLDSHARLDGVADKHAGVAGALVHQHAGVLDDRAAARG